ncbi:MAG: hypothetical protein HPY54_02470 [Chthonomonadetes bacterium]|nr:hypothetical protein [Chthonomonadetes bacterium]
MDVLFLVAQAALLILAGVMVLRVREELQLLVRQATSSQQSEQIKHLQEELQQTLREVRVTLSEGIAKLEERIARAEQVLHALEVHAPNAPQEVAAEPGVRVPVERILALADSGCDVKEIARLTGIAEGEVQLVLQIRAQRSEKESSGNSVQRNERTEE